MAENPFQSPAVIDEPDVPFAEGGELPPITTRLVARTTLRWTVICGVAAIPSFLLGLVVTQNQPWGVFAMCLGILLFAIGYSVCDLFLIRRWCHNSRAFHRSLRIGLGFRLAASIIVPIGTLLDMYPGIAAVGICNAISFAAREAVSFPVVIAITFLQGIFLNILLYGFVLFVFAIYRLRKSDLFRTRL
ncbi:hypothetical protein ACFL2H_01275 [Planctomycetota bacterium]